MADEDPYALRTHDITWKYSNAEKILDLLIREWYVNKCMCLIWYWIIKWAHVWSSMFSKQARGSFVRHVCRLHCTIPIRSVVQFCWIMKCIYNLSRSRRNIGRVEEVLGWSVIWLDCVLCLQNVMQMCCIVFRQWYWMLESCLMPKANSTSWALLLLIMIIYNIISAVWIANLQLCYLFKQSGKEYPSVVALKTSSTTKIFCSLHGVNGIIKFMLWFSFSKWFPSQPLESTRL